MGHYYSEYDEEERAKAKRKQLKDYTDRYEESIKKRGIAGTLAYIKMGWL